MFSVHTLAARPNGVLLASATASAGVPDGTQTRTRPQSSPSHLAGELRVTGPRDELQWLAPLTGRAGPARRARRPAPDVPPRLRGPGEANPVPYGALASRPAARPGAADPRGGSRRRAGLVRQR